MDWKRSLSITGLVLCALAAHADRIERDDAVVPHEQASPGVESSKAQSPRQPLFESPMNFDECLLDGRRFGCHRHPVPDEIRKKGKGKRKGKVIARVHRIKFHHGWDILARPKGLPDLRAIGEGEVVSVGGNGKCGNAVKIKLKNGYFTNYCHLSTIAKGLKAGDKVMPGQVVGKMGESGLCTGPHLHMVVSTCEDSQKCSIDPALILDPNNVCKMSEPDETTRTGC